jgi:hypothetical protein
MSNFLFELVAWGTFLYCFLFTVKAISKAFDIDMSLFNFKPDYRLFVNNQEVIPNKNTKNIYINVEDNPIEEKTKVIKKFNLDVKHTKDIPLEKALKKKTAKSTINPDIFN